MNKEMKRSPISTNQTFSWRIQDDGSNPGRDCLIRLVQLTEKAITDVITEALLEYEKIQMKGRKK